MAYSLTWTERASAEVREIAAYITSHDSVVSAAGVVAAIAESADRLADFPFSGRKVRGVINPNLREIFVFDYRIIYVVDDDLVEVRMVRHTRRRFPPKKEMHRLR